MPRDVSQLLLQVDANVAVAQRNLQQLSRVVQQSADGMNTSLDSTARAHTKLNNAMGNTRIAQMELQHVITASSDAYAAGASPVRILTMEMGRLAEAATFLGGSGTGVMGKLGAFMSGPWGIAVLLGVGFLSQLIAKHHDAGDSVEELIEKMKKQARQADITKEANAAWLKTYEGAAQNIDQVVDALDKENRSLQENTRLKQQGLRDNIKSAQDERANLVSQLQDKQRQLGLANSMAGGGFLDKQSIINDLAEIGRKINEVDARIAKAQRGIRESGFEEATVEAKALADPIAKINKRYDDMAAAAKRAAAGNDALAASLVKTLAGIEHQREAATKAAQESKRGSGYSGNQISFAEARQIAQSGGLQVNSAQRTFAQQKALFDAWVAQGRPKDNPVAPPGTSTHEGAKGRWALDIQLAPGVTAGKIKKLYADKGVDVDVFPERGHLHVSGSTARATASENATARAAQKQQTDDDQFARESAQLDAAILQAKRQLVGGFDTQAKIADDEIDAEKAAQLQAIQKQVDGQQITAAQGKILSAKVEELATTKKAAVDNRAYLEALDQTRRAMEQSLGFRLDDLHFADDMATSQAEHRKLQLQILDIQYQQKKAELEYQLMLIKRNQDFATSPALQDQAALVQGQIDRLPTQQAEDQERVRRGTMNPLEAWAKSVPHDAATIKEALQSIETQGLDSLASSITDVIMGTKSLGAAFKDIARSIIADIIQMTIKMLIFRAISSVLGGGMPIPGGGASSVNIGGGPLSAGGPTNFSNILGTTSFFRAAGGPVSANQPYVVGEKGPELFMPHSSGMIIPNASTVRIPGAANNNAPAHVVVELRDEMLDARIENGAGKVVIAAAPHMVRAAHDQTVRSISRPRMV